MAWSQTSFLHVSLSLTFALLLAKVSWVEGQLTWIQLHNGSLHDENVMTSMPAGRRDAILSFDVSRNQLVLFGGRPGPLNDTWIYNLTSLEWRELNSTARPYPPARYGAVGGVSGHYFYVATGRGLDNVHFNDVWRLDLRTEKWEELLPAPLDEDSDSSNSSSQPYTPSGRYFAAGGIYVTGARLYISQGTSDVMRTAFTFAFDVDTKMWYKEDRGGCGLYDAECPHPRYLHSGVMTNREQLVIFSGCLSGEGTAGPCPSHDAWRYDGQSKTWTQMDSCPAPRLYSTMALLPSSDDKTRVLLYGGQADTSTVLRDNVTDIPIRRLSASMATGPNGIFLFGGASHHGVATNDLWLLRGNSTDVDLSPTLPCAPITITMVTVHGILMAIGFGLLLPLGALLMRHCRCLYTHIAFQTTGLCCAVAGLAVGVVSVRTSHMSFCHAIVGIVALALAVLQPLNALLRPRELPNEGGQRGVVLKRLWRWVHRFGGRVSILLGLANGSVGIFLAVATLPIVIAWHAWLGLLLLLTLLAELVRCLRLLRRRGSGQTSPSPRSRGKNQADGIINGWEKGDSAFVNPTTETVRL